MSYQSPIELIMSDMNTHIQNASLEREMNIESTILKAIEKVGVVIDKDELIRAIRYDRDQYQKGYDDRDAEIVRCKDCKHKGQIIHQKDGTNIIVCWNQGYGIHHPIDWFCADGKKEKIR